MKFLNIDGHRFAYDVVGQGPLAVVLETGLGAESSEWTGVQAALGGIATTFRYDRVGRGESSPAGSPRDALAMVRCLRALLGAANVAPPFLFVGHSFGGLLGQIFADRYRSETSGLILVESVHTEQFEKLGPAFPAPRSDDPPPLVSMRAFWTEGWKNTDSTPEKIDFVSSFQQAPGSGALDGLPLRVLTTGSMLRNTFIPSEARSKLQRRWSELQDRLCSLSDDVVHTKWPSSGHFLQRGNPCAIAAAIVDIGLQISGETK